MLPGQTRSLVNRIRWLHGGEKVSLAYTTTKQQSISGTDLPNTHLLLGDLLCNEHEMTEQGLVAVHCLAELGQTVPALGDHQEVHRRLRRRIVADKY